MPKECRAPTSLWKTNNETDLPDRMFEEAGKLAGYYSSGRDSDKIEIDYLQKKNVKKPNGSAPVL